MAAQIITKEDLDGFREKLLKDLKEIIGKPDFLCDKLVRVEKQAINGRAVK